MSRLITSLKSKKKSQFSLDYLKMMFSWKIYQGKTFVRHLRKTIYAHTSFWILRKFFFLLCFGHLFSVMMCSVCHFCCGKHIHKRPCLSVSLSVRPSVPAFASTFHHRLPWYFIIWLETPTACGSQFFKVIWQISKSHRPKKLSETGQI